MKEKQSAAAQRMHGQAQQIKTQSGLPVQGTKKRKVRLDVTIPADTKTRLMRYAEKKGLSVSVIVQMLIDEACN